MGMWADGWADGRAGAGLAGGLATFVGISTAARTDSTHRNDGQLAGLQ